MELIVKICGLSNEETLDAALDAGAEMIGLVIFAPSPRFVAPEKAAKLATRARRHAQVVLLTVDMDESELAEIVDLVQPDWLQFHGHETPEFVSSAKMRFGRKIMKAVGVQDKADLSSAQPYAAVADRILLDAKPPKNAVLPGGRGETFDWQLLKDFDPRLPFILSGGLNTKNVTEAVRIARPIGVDVSSGVETAPGRKDVDLISEFVVAARAAAGVLPARSAQRIAS